MIDPIVIGIDPGKKGALVALNPDNSLCLMDLSEFYDDKGASQSSVNPEYLRRWLDGYLIHNGTKQIAVCCEKPIFVGAGFTVKTPMSMYESFGVFRGVFTGYGIPFTGVHPREWQKHYPELYHPKVKRTKDESVEKAIDLFPAYTGAFARINNKGRSKGNVVLMDGRAEAALIANYAKENMVSLF